MNLSEDTFLDVLNETLNETLNASTSEVSEASSTETLITEFVFEVCIESAIFEEVITLINN